MSDENIAELTVNEETSEVILQLSQPAVAMSPEQAEDWCAAFYDAAQEAKEARDD
jgi:hypothetical protein